MSDFLLLFVGFIIAAVWTFYLVACHRLCLSADQTLTLREAYRPRQGQLRYFSFLVQLMVLCAVWAFLIGILLAITIPDLFSVFSASNLGKYAFIYVSFILLARLWMVFPAAAVEEPLSYRQSCALTRRNGLRLAGIALAVCLPCFGLEALLSLSSVRISAIVLDYQLYRGTGIKLSPYLFKTIFALLDFLILVLTVVSISIAYRRLRADSPPSL